MKTKQLETKYLISIVCENYKLCQYVLSALDNKERNCEIYSDMAHVFHSTAV